jgi:hypothetical protein
MLDQDTNRVLVSEALKDRLTVKENDQDANTPDTLIAIEIIFAFGDDKLSFAGPVIELEIMQNLAICVQLKSSIPDGYELFSLLNQKDYSCIEYNMNYLDNSVKLSGPFKASLKRMMNFDIVKNQCVLVIELIKVAQ